MSISPSLSAKELVDEYFMENRTRLLEIGAFLDRLSRIDPGYGERDFRMKAFNMALANLSSPNIEHINQIQMLFSDPTAEPIPFLDKKSAAGAYDRSRQE